MSKNPIHFEQLPNVDDLSGVIEDMFGVKLDISGGWGYDNSAPVIVNSLDIPIDQFLHMFASIRANTEMNLYLEEKQRYGSINCNFIEGKQVEIENQLFDMITFEITAMKEIIYADLIDEYKENYGKNEEFDLEDHFKRRKENTIKLETDFWFTGLEKYYVENPQ